MKQNSLCRRTVTVDLKNGLHLVPCSRIAQLTRQYECDVRIHNADLTVDAKNVLDLMTLKADFGTHLDLEAHGEGAAEVVEKLARLFETNFESEGDEA